MRMLYISYLVRPVKEGRVGPGAEGVVKEVR